IAFADGLHTNGEAFLNGIGAIDSNVIVAGGLAGDNSTFSGTYVFTHEQIISKGIVAVGLHGSHLHVNTHYSFNWQRIGLEMSITKVENNRVYTIGERSALATYAHYLGDDIANNLPHIGIEFPLIIERDGVLVARAVTTKNDDGSLTFAGNFRANDKVRFGYGNAKNILNHTQTMLDSLEKEPCEALFIYSCMARRHFMPNDIESETLPLADIAPASGFFTYGEFFTAQKRELLNQSMTVLALSESDSITSIQTKSNKKAASIHLSSTNALAHLINVTSIEVETQAKTLQNYTHQLEQNLDLLTQKSRELKRQEAYLEKSQEIAHIGVWEYNLQKNFLYWSDEIYRIFGFTPKSFKPSYGKFLEFTHPEDRDLLDKEFTLSIEEKRPYNFSHRILRKDGSLRYLEERGEHSYDAQGAIIKTVGVVLDVTDRKELEIMLLTLNKNLDSRVKEEIEKNKLQEQKLFQHSRMAQMGEMISMIAHQWRQPLGAITSTALNLQTKLELKTYNLRQEEGRESCRNYFQERLQKINTFAYSLSTTIDDFRNFYKPNKQSIFISLEEVTCKSLNIIQASLENDNIEIIQEYATPVKYELYDSELMQVILNILKNAQDNFKEKKIKYPKITITTQAKSLSICDNGGGIPKDILGNIFDPYFSTKDAKNGTGLGLYMSKIIIEEHHKGSLHVNNTNDGVCF
ncbi:MAG: PAS domain-containing protein, partial [Campylobacterota bacterium]|nr:PAS domain-containing protein [Campylobacterota bacterium]